MLDCYLKLAPDPRPAPSAQEEALPRDVDQQLYRVVRLTVAKPVERGFLSI